jgi:hypothetical protein
MPGFKSVVPQESCAACGITLRLTEMEPVPTRPEKSRCRDERACTDRFTEQGRQLQAGFRVR